MWPQGWVWRFSILALIAIIAVAAALWFGREEIAGDLIDDALAANDLEASYEIIDVGPQRQVIGNVVVGDPAAPDLTIDQVIVDIAYSFGAPALRRVELVRPRIYGRQQDGLLSFGALDPLIYAEGDGTTGLPALDIAVVDGRARIETDYAVIGAKLEGAGRLDDGFAGMLAATAPGIGTQTCRASAATVYGSLSVESGKPIFDGPVRLRELDCEGAKLAKADVAARIEVSEALDAIDSNFGLDAGQLSFGDYAVGELGGAVDLLWRFAGEGGAETGDMSVRHDLTAQSVISPYAKLGEMNAKGTLRLTGNMARSELISRIEGERVELAIDATSAIANARAGAEGTFAAALLAKAERGLTSGLADARLVGDVTMRTSPEGVRVIVPEARLRSGSGDTLIALSRLSYAASDQPGGDSFTGNFITGGRDLPLVNGRMEQRGNGALALRMAMAEYREGVDAITIPRLELRQNASGNFAFNGMAQAEGALPGGSISGLVLPIEGGWSSGGGLTLGRACTEVGLAGLELYQLSLAGQRLTLCPEEGASAMVRYDDTLTIAIATEDIDLSGALGTSQTRFAASSAVLRYPGPFEVAGLEAVIGEADSAVRLTAETLEGVFADTIGGSFEGGSAQMDIVPLDLSQLGGTWAYSDSVLRVGEGAFTLTERIDPANGTDPRFEPLSARGARLTLEDGAIRAQAELRHPASQSLVTRIAIRHDLSSGEGAADIAVPGVRFTEEFQPDDLSIFTRGVIAAADGTITGNGLVSWTADDITSSGTFETDEFDFAAAFGPVRDISGSITFTDLINLTTAPGQVLNIGSVNPGIEALEGRVVYSLTDGTLITIEDGRWPFMGGKLILRPTQLNYGGSGGQSYVFEVVELDAATFVSQVELTNIGASGTFDGTIPIHFDELGNGSIEGGLLISRPPGGNISYVGELTYEDLGTMANYAFQSLRSLDFRQMSVELNGNLAGEIITNFQFDGVRQGEGASRNFVTRRLAELPIRFKINVRSETFYDLALIVRGIFDPRVFQRPDDLERLGIGSSIFVPIEDSGFAPFDRSPDPEPQSTSNPGEAQRRDEPAVQPPESDELP